MAEEYRDLLDICGGKEYIQCKGNFTTLTIIVDGKSVYYGTVDGNNLDKLRQMAFVSLDIKSLANTLA